ncbi:YncE family protein [Rhizosphaericola mali]|uniref:YncE family protein n=1 Tax=Rhizosphaericola mali TaxID=2545455 RepID=A0A5P2G305_9BACT|nr:YncE family protein [Rhizosphaericola mali]QES87493.1 YncE family protein [Rhizosphaericola mali]
MKIKIILIISLLQLIIGCKKETNNTQEVSTQAISDTSNVYQRLYILNEGNMSENRSTIDYVDFSAQKYYSNIYPYINPTVVKELGDVGNDIQIYGSKMYAVINMSNKVEIMDAATAKHLGETTIKNARNICFANGKAYITAYNRDISTSTTGDSNNADGIVVELDTTNYNIINTVEVGRQPDGIAVYNNQLYVANSGGYNPDNYDHTVSIIDLNTFTVTKTLNVAINLNQVKVNNSLIYVSSRGDYNQIRSKLFIINGNSNTVQDSIDVSVSNFDIYNNTAYIIGTPYSNQTGTITSIQYLKINLTTNTINSESFISDGTNSQITLPYGLLVNPSNGDVYVTDAKDYQTSGTVYCFNAQGTKKWSATGGQIPGHFALLKK